MQISRIDIIVGILEETRSATNKTGVVYSANLNSGLADKYLEFLEKQGLIEFKSEKYIITQKGKIFLKKVEDLTLALEAPISGSAILT